MSEASIFRKIDYFLNRRIMFTEIKSYRVTQLDLTGLKSSLPVVEEEEISLLQRSRVLQMHLKNKHELRIESPRNARVKYAFMQITCQ